MASPVAARRLEIFAAARAAGPDFLRFDPARLRFSLGTSISDLKVPVQVVREAEQLVGAAAVEVALLLASRHRRFVAADEVDRLMLREDFARTPAAAPSLGPTGGGPDLKAAAQLGVSGHPALTGGITCVWMGPGGRGRSLTALFIEALRQGFAEMAACEGREETPVVAALALHGELHRAAEALRSVLPGPPVDRYLRGAALCALWIAARTGLARAWRDSGRQVDDPLLARLEAVLSPGTLLGGRAAILAGGVTLYGCELSAGVPRADEITARLAAGGDPDAAIAELAQILERDEELSRRAEAAVAVARLREALANALPLAEAGGQERAVADLRDLFCAPGGLAAALADEASRKALAQRLADAAAVGGDAAAVFDGAHRTVKGYRPKEPAASAGLRREVARSEYAVAATALLCDAALERAATPARRAIMPRTGAEAEGGAEAEYEAGRLYRIGPRGPILRQQAEADLGHLFADVKDFTRRTGLLGQAAMAEFLRREFYLPILTAAKEHYAGMQHLADKGGVYLNNLVGDAISFSGGIEAMVALALDIKRLLASYAARLTRELSSDVVARQVAAIEEAHAEARARLSRGVKDAREAVARAAPGSREAGLGQARLAQAVAEETRLEEERQRALTRARGEGLEAGVFISFGPAPLVVQLEDEVFGRSRVAIADKINESARGTARATAGRARADALLAAERAARRAPGLAHAWSVFVGHPLAVALAPEAEIAALRAARSGDLAAALRTLAGPVKESLEAAARAGSDAPGDLYNSGAALSEEALDAFLRAVHRARIVKRISFDPAAAPGELKARFWFGDQPQRLVVTFDATAQVREMFRYAGKAAMKGLADVPVWELCADTGGPAALARALGARWFKGR